MISSAIRTYRLPHPLSNEKYPTGNQVSILLFSPSFQSPDQNNTLRSRNTIFESRSDPENSPLFEYHPPKKEGK
jgi:hypothetical protein